MTPAQRTTLSAARALEVAEGLKIWISSGGTVGGALAPSLADEIDGTIVRLRRAHSGIDSAPAVAVLGESIAAHLDIAASLAAAPGTGLVVELGGGPIRLDGVLASRDGAAIGAVVRLVDAAGPKSSPEFPIPASLLSELDVVKILAAVGESTAPLTAASATPPASMNRTFFECGRRLLPDPVAGFTSNDVADLRLHFADKYPRSDYFANLSAAGYWRALDDLLPFVGAPDRRRLLAFLWRDGHEISGLFARLSEGLEQAGYVTDVVLPLEAVAYQR